MLGCLAQIDGDNNENNKILTACAFAHYDLISYLASPGHYI
ncbi:protein of unknown function [Shewanella benthica]|uniref:Uncharacterized protein n=1 Tax=Shewanella benthica TaxID=43661 RepID=A0A330LW94_9GAMM|nr:protein of unknown function [Shewanella benthica]